jgi:Spy/CpxP family protein refolding chaperone
METWLKNLTFVSFLVAVIVAVGISSVHAAGDGHGHRFGADMTLISSLGLSQDEQTALMNALSQKSQNGPTVKEAMQAFHAAKKQLNTDLQAAAPNGDQLVADAQALAKAKADLKAAHAKLNSALNSALTTEHLQQLQTKITEQFQSRLDSKTGRLLFGYALSLKRQSQQAVSSSPGDAQ